MVDSSVASGDVSGEAVGVINCSVGKGIGLGFLIILSLYFVSMIIYFAVKKKNAHHKWLVEVLTILIVVFFTFVIKVIVYLKTNKLINEYGGMISVWRALYATIGGLTFEGMEEASDIIIKLQCCYYGSSVYAGLMVLSVITMKWNYEIFSRITLFAKWVFNKKKDIFVFTDLNEETLQLAQSIKKKYEDSNKKNNYIIVFSGPRLDAFDRNDDLCRKIVAESFLYWSYYKDKKKKAKKSNKYICKSIAEILHLNNDNVRKENSKTERRFCVFAYESKKHIPEEENNMGFVFDDIKNRINKDKLDNLRIEYFILTKRDINYQAYDYKNRELALEFADSVVSKVMIDNLIEEWCNEKGQGDKIDERKKCFNKTLKNFKNTFLQNGDDDKYNGHDNKEDLNFCAKILKKAFAKYVVVTAINEALIISKDAIMGLTLPFEEKNFTEKNSRGEQLNVFVLGFGSTGQAIAKAIHMRSAYINEAGFATNILFEVFDSKTKEIAGLFVRENPMWIYCKDDKKKKLEAKYDDKEATFKGDIVEKIVKGKTAEEENKTLEEFYRKDEIGEMFGEKNICGKDKNEAWEKVSEIIKKEIICPIVHFNSKSCFDLDILELLDNATGKNKTPNSAPIIPAIIVIALGSDYDNVRMANSLIPDIVRESRKKSKEELEPQMIPEPQTIIVNIWDKNNNDLIYSAGGVWEDDHKLLKLEDANLTVKIVGNNTDIYSYKKMVDHSDFAKYHSGYNNMCDKANKIKFLSKLNAYLSKGEEFEQLKDSINEILYVDTENAKAMEAYENVDMWKRESTDCVILVEEMFANLLNKEWIKEKSYAERCRYLSRVEHQRWLRLHIANGWVYSDTKNTLLKEHNCIIPFNELGDDTRYNLINALMLIIKDIDRWKDESEYEKKDEEEKQSADEEKNCEDEAFQEVAAGIANTESINAEEVISVENWDKKEETATEAAQEEKK